MAGHAIIVVGASAGGVEALSKLVGGLPPDLPATLFVVLHVPPESTSFLPTILDRAGPLSAAHATHGESIQHGRIYVAPPDHHLVLAEDGRMRVVRGPRENRHRPAIDPLFRSAARVYGPRVVGVVLTGALDDGTAGLAAIKQRGGSAIVQEPDEALYPSMPRSALENVDVDYRLPLAEIPPVLARMVNEPAQEEGAYSVPEGMDAEAKITELDMTALQNDVQVGTPSIFSCPECGGVLREIHDGKLVRFRCRVGHAFSIESMLAEQNEALEEALYAALNTLEESTSLSRRLAKQASQQGRQRLAERFEEKVRTTQQRADLIRQVLLKQELISPEELSRPEQAVATDEKSSRSS